MFTKIDKFLVAVATFASNCLAYGLLHGTAQTVVLMLLSILGALGVYAVPNLK